MEGQGCFELVAPPSIGVQGLPAVAAKDASRRQRLSAVATRRLDWARKVKFTDRVVYAAEKQGAASQWAFAPRIVNQLAKEPLDEL